MSAVSEGRQSQPIWLTGTPSGVGPLVAGDRLEVEIPGLGVLANPVAALG
jgi:2-keto-4-pentenoate hydratase/2-oxohepta-3-ene-1,7-dioic acid hydratase in catechol pathway